MMYAGFPSFYGLGLDDGHVPTFWLLLCSYLPHINPKSPFSGALYLPLKDPLEGVFRAPRNLLAQASLPRSPMDWPALRPPERRSAATGAPKSPELPFVIRIFVL